MCLIALDYLISILSLEAQQKVTSNQSGGEGPTGSKHVNCFVTSKILPFLCVHLSHIQSCKILHTLLLLLHLCFFAIYHSISIWMCCVLYSIGEEDDNEKDFLDSIRMLCIGSFMPCWCHLVSVRDCHLQHRCDRCNGSRDNTQRKHLIWLVIWEKNCATERRGLVVCFLDKVKIMAFKCTHIS